MSSLCVLVVGFLFSFSSFIPNSHASKRPHIIYILADDMGWNDVSFHGSDQIPTPNIDSLAYNGVILNRHYTQPLCTPSRASLMTGKYAIHTGLHDALLPTNRAGLSLDEKLLSQYLKELGYSTHLVGKWHLGFYKKEFTPLQRGFDSHFGYWSGAISYYDHIDENPVPTLRFSGHDMRRNYTSACDLVGQYATDLFTNEAVHLIENHPSNKPMFMLLTHLAAHAGNQGKWLEAPQDEINRFWYITDPNRRSYAAMVSKLDQSVGAVVDALDKRDMLKDSIIIFVSDNGAPNIGVYKNWGSNFPWRGQKATLWEGAVRTPALIWSPLIRNPSRVSHSLMHISDWLPTLLAAIGIKDELSNIDGLNQWEAISQGYTGPRHELVVDIDEESNMNSIIFENFKYVKGPISPTDNSEVSKFLNLYTLKSRKQPKYNIEEIFMSPAWQAVQKYTNAPPSVFKIVTLREEATVTCFHHKDVNCTDEPCVFDLKNDPCEQVNIANYLPIVVQHLEEKIDNYKQSAISVTLVEDPSSNPDRFDGDWSIWVE